MAAKALALTKVDIEEALVSGQMKLAYQPIFDLTDGSLARVEALVRWEHPRLGTLLPAIFIPAFEAEGRLQALTRRVIERAAAEFGSWAFRKPSGLSLNLTVGDLADDTLPNTIKSVLEAVRMDPAALTLECPVLSTEAEAARKTLHELKDLGVRLAAEMMGRTEDVAEAFSIAPFDEVKTAGRGLLRAARNNHTSTLTTASDLIAFAEARGATVTAIGAEDEASCIALKTVGYHQVQANVLAPAMQIDAITPRVTNVARQVLGFESSGAVSPADAPAPAKTDQAFEAQRRRAQGEILRRAAELKRDTGEGEDNTFSTEPLIGAKAVQAALAGRFGRLEESLQPCASDPQDGDGEEEKMEAESKAGLLMRPDLASASLGYGASPLRKIPRKEPPKPTEEVAQVISDVLGALPTDERPKPFPDEAKAEKSAEDILDDEVAKLPMLEEQPIPTDAVSPAREELLSLASRLRSTPTKQKNFLQRKYKLRVTHFWPKPWKRAFVRLMEEQRRGSFDHDAKTWMGPLREENRTPTVSLKDKSDALTVDLPRRKPAEARG